MQYAVETLNHLQIFIHKVPYHVFECLIHWNSGTVVVNNPGFKKKYICKM